MSESADLELDIENVEAYEGLSEEEKSILVSSTVYAYADTNIDGYGDEGAGYDGDAFVRNLLAMGWTFNGVV